MNIAIELNEYRNWFEWIQKSNWTNIEIKSKEYKNEIEWIWKLN